MSGKAKFIAALAAMYFFLGAVMALFYAALWTSLEHEERQAVLHILEGHEGVIIFILLAALTVLGMAFQHLYRQYVSTPLRHHETLKIILTANTRLRLPLDGSAEMRALAHVINQLADKCDALQHNVQKSIEDAKATIEEEKNRLAALMSELNQSVIVCTIDGRILLYNHRARLIFQAADSRTRAPPGNTLIGLGRSIFAVLERNLITHALETIRQRLNAGDAQPVANFVTTSRTGQLIRTQMAPVFNAQAAVERRTERTIGGFVLILENITRRFDVESQRDRILQSLTEGSRSSLANIRAAVENMIEYPDMEQAQRDRFLSIMRDEVQAMGQRLDHTVNEFANALKVRWPLEEMLAFDLIEAAQQRIEQRLLLPTKTEDVAEGLWIKVDSFSLLQGLTYLASRLKEEFQVREVRFRLAAAGRLAHLDLIWSGVVISTETLIGWETDPMNTGGETTPLTLREVVERHGGEIWFQRDKASHRSYCRILIPTALPPESPMVEMHSASRPEYYDFDLFQQTEETRALDDRLLTQLSYTVFDTETTGLDPSAGDEIIQIGAARIVNGRLLKSEVFDRLVDPNRLISPDSIKIHGITNDMLSGCPTIERIMPDFHAFCEDTVLIGHNAAFDMRFLRMKEESTGIRFRQPVLDTLLLSAVIHPNQDSHRLEAIAERLGIDIVGRHTALGDALVTGEVFLKMLPLLAEKGIRTLREAREAAERTYYAKVKY